jgi:hypothetical protein
MNRNVNVTVGLPTPARGVSAQNWWRNLGVKYPPGYYIPVNNSGRLKIVPGRPDPHGVWLVVNNRIVINGNKISSRTKRVGNPARLKTLFHAWKNGNRANAMTMIQNLRHLKMNQRVGVKQMINEIIRERGAAMKNAAWKASAGISRLNVNSNNRHRMTIDFWKWISNQINTGPLARAANLRAPRTNSASPARTRSRGRSAARTVLPPNAWNN